MNELLTHQLALRDMRTDKSRPFGAGVGMSQTVGDWVFFSGVGVEDKSKKRHCVSGEEKRTMKIFGRNMFVICECV